MEIMEKTIIEYAKKTFLAMKNPYGSVERVYQSAIDSFYKENDYPVKYAGVKNTNVIPASLIKNLEQNGNYVLHTLDKMAIGGRAVDIQLKNPITGRNMTGSSSGTAINVLLGINDLGIGTDGGGSVLAPAMSLNLFGFISPLIESEAMKRHKKISTDKISFFPSIGFITREWSELMEAVYCALPVKDNTVKEELTIYKTAGFVKKLPFKALEIDTPDVYGDRGKLIEFLKEKLTRCDFLVTYEGAVDLYGFGETIFGHFDAGTKERQRKGGKGLIRAANMADATSVCIPAEELGCAYVLLCESKSEKLNAMLLAARELVKGQDPLVCRYFLNKDNYFPKQFGDL